MIVKSQVMENNETTPKRWFSIQEAAKYLDVGEPTVYRWMRENKITYRKVGDSTRFWQEDLDSVMEVYHSEKDLEKAREVCPVCRHDELIVGKVRTTGLNYFAPAKTKFWTLKDSFIATTAKMCGRCGAITWFGDVPKLTALQKQAKAKQTATESTGSTL